MANVSVCQTLGRFDIYQTLGSPVDVLETSPTMLNKSNICEICIKHLLNIPNTYDKNNKF